MEEEAQGRGDGAEEEGVACHICLMNIYTGEKESVMMFWYCDTSFSTFVHMKCFHDLDVPLKCEIHNFVFSKFIL